MSSVNSAIFYTVDRSQASLEGSGARHASILLDLIFTRLFGERLESARVQLKRALRSEIYSSEARGDALLRPRTSSSGGGGQRAAREVHERASAAVLFAPLLAPLRAKAGAAEAHQACAPPPPPLPRDLEELAPVAAESADRRPRRSHTGSV